MKLKDIPIIDIGILVAGFFLRVLFGSAITGIKISTWLFLTVIAISFYLGLEKRRNKIKLKNAAGVHERFLLTTTMHSSTRICTCAWRSPMFSMLFGLLILL